jgi:3'(2'), 5'-bisphosphate nucleotidase
MVSDLTADDFLTVIKAAYKAGRKILEIYESDMDFGVESKADNSPLTIADKQSHKIIRSALMSLDIPFMSEEGRSIPYEERSQWQRYWLVDPLDGTKEFIKRNGEFTVNIALIDNREPVLGIVYVPVSDTMYFAEKGVGAFKLQDFSRVYPQIWGSESLGAAGGEDFLFTVAEQLPVPDDYEASGNGRKYKVVGSRSHATQELQDYVEELKRTHGDIEFVSAGSSLKFCLVAEGRADHYPRLGPTMEWDTAAGQVLAESAGARVLEYESGEMLQYNKEKLLNPWFVVER